MHHHREKTRVPGARGHTLVEAMLLIAIFTLFVLGIGGMLNFGFTSTRALDDRQTAMHYAQTYMARLNALPYGGSLEMPPSEVTIKDFFENGTVASDLTLVKLRAASMLNEESIDISVDGLEHDIRVTLSDDLNGDGDDSDACEGNCSVLRMEVFYNGVSLLRTYRSDSTAGWTWPWP
jgi:hypothetical protein